MKALGVLLEEIDEEHVSPDNFAAIASSRLDKVCV